MRVVSFVGLGLNAKMAKGWEDMKKLLGFGGYRGKTSSAK
jgi:hypothetical protein